MTTFPVRVRWGKNRYDLEVDTSEIPMLFKAQLMTITDVPMERQKIIYKGRILNDDSWDEFPITENTLLTLVGTNEPAPAVCPESTVKTENIVENETELIKNALDENELVDIPLGFYNYGNTCYINSVIQFFKRIGPIRRYLLSLPDINDLSTLSLQEKTLYVLKKIILYSEIDLSADKLDFSLREILSLIDKQFPEFAELNDAGIRKQHDSSEFFGKILNIFKKKLEITDIDTGEVEHVIDNCMKVEYQQQMCLRDTPNSKPEISYISDYSIQCVIDTTVREISNGIKLSLEDLVEKYNDDLKKNCEYSKILKFHRLPQFLVVNLNRFHYKAKQNITAKIVKDIKFPHSLDLYNFCSDDYKAKLVSMRDAISSHKQMKNIQLNEDNKEPTIQENIEDSVISLPQQNLGQGTSGSALYNLKAIITHRGRNSTEGHYVCWLKLKNQYWAKMDDNEVVVVSVDEINKLSGGGEWHIAYNFLYECEKFPPK